MVSISPDARIARPLTAAQVRALAFACFSKPLSVDPVEVRLQTGLQGAALTQVSNALQRRELVDRSGAVTDAGIAALAVHRPVHVSSIAA